MRQKSARTRRYLEGFIGAVFDGLGTMVMLGLVMMVSLGWVSPVGAYEGWWDVDEAWYENEDSEAVYNSGESEVLYDDSKVVGDEDIQKVAVQNYDLEVMPGVASELQFSIRDEMEEVTGADVTIIGDSITEYSLEEVRRLLPAAKISAVSGTQFIEENSAGESGMERLGQTGMRQIIVFAMGTNGGVTDEDISELLEKVGERSVILMTIYRPEAEVGAKDPNADFDVGESNAAIWKAGYSHNNVYVMDWAGLVETAEDESDVIRDDHLHPNEEGAELFARLVREAVWRVLQENVVEEPVMVIENTLPFDVWMGLAVFGIVVVTAAVMSAAVGVARGRARRRRERAQQRWQEARMEEKTRQEELDKTDAKEPVLVEVTEEVMISTDNVDDLDQVLLDEKKLEEKIIAAFDEVESGDMEEVSVEEVEKGTAEEEKGVKNAVDKSEEKSKDIKTATETMTEDVKDAAKATEKSDQKPMKSTNDDVKKPDQAIKRSATKTEDEKIVREVPEGTARKRRTRRRQGRKRRKK